MPKSERNNLILTFEDNFWGWLAQIGEPFAECDEAYATSRSEALILRTKIILPSGVFDDYVIMAGDVIQAVKDEVDRRFEAKEAIFENQAHYDICGDGKLFTDLPAHIAAMGKEKVEAFLNDDWLFPALPIECFSYIFQPYKTPSELS